MIDWLLNNDVTSSIEYMWAANPLWAILFVLAELALISMFIGGLVSLWRRGF